MISSSRATVTTTADEVQPLVETFLRERGLSLSEEKTRITHIETGFDFLGQNIRKYRGKLLIKPSTKNVQAFLSKVRTIIKANKAAKAGHLILQLNPIIRGWAHYHRHVVSKQTFRRVDSEIFKAVWQWAKRRHPQRAGMDSPEVLWRIPTPQMALQWRADRGSGKTTTRLALAPAKSHPTTHQGQGSGQSV